MMSLNHQLPQIMEEDDFDELDEFEAALMAEENDFDGNGTTFAYSDEMLAKVGDDTYFEIGNLVENETATEELINTVQQADNVILNARIKVIERESKEKDLKVEEMLSEINTLNIKLSTKDKTIEASLSKINSLEDNATVKNTRVKTLEDNVNAKSNRINLLERALKKSLKKNRATSESDDANIEEDIDSLKRKIKSKNNLI